jgi:hypothetical protein
MYAFIHLWGKVKAIPIAVYFPPASGRAMRAPFPTRAPMHAMASGLAFPRSCGSELTDWPAKKETWQMRVYMGVSTCVRDEGSALYLGGNIHPILACCALALFSGAYSGRGIIFSGLLFYPSGWWGIWGRQFATRGTYRRGHVSL